MRHKKNFGYPIKLTVSGQNVDSRNITKVVITRDFMGARFPIIMLSIQMDLKQHADIVEPLTPNKPFLDVFMDLYETEVEQEFIPDSYFMGGKFLGIIDRQHSILTKSMQDNYDLHNTEHKQETKTVRITLMRKRDIPSMRGMINGILNGPLSMSTLLLYGFQKASTNLQMCLMPPHNAEVSNDVIIPPMGFYQYLEYLDNEYGIYRTRYHVFIEDSIAYVMHLENETGIKVNGNVHKIFVETVGKEYIDQYTSITKEGDYDIIRVPEESGYNESSSFSHLGKTVGADVVEATVNTVTSEMTHSVEYSNHTSRPKMSKSSDYEVERNDIIIDDIPVKVKPFTIVEVRNNQFVRQYRIEKHSKIIDYTSNTSKDILSLMRVVK